MNWDMIQGRWAQLKGDIKGHWGKLSDDDMLRVEGRRDRLVGIIQERYGMLKDQAEREVDTWITRLEHKA
jgi:uncharacterized protein YjbJ (UPF0337 family)